MGDNVALELLRAIRGDIGAMQTDVIAIKQRLGLIEGVSSAAGQTGVSGDVETAQTAFSGHGESGQAAKTAGLSTGLAAEAAAVIAKLMAQLAG